MVPTTLRKAVAPVGRIAPRMKTGDHDDLISLNREEDDVGEASKKSLPDFTLDDRKSIRAIP